MRKNPFIKVLLVQILLIVAVTFIFKVIPDRQIAAALAGVLFLLMPTGALWYCRQYMGLRNWIWSLSVILFLTCFSIPIFFLRILNWGIPFDQLQFLGISGPQFHYWSSKSYMVMMAATIWESWKLWRHEIKKPA